MRQKGQRFPSDRRAWFRVLEDVLDDERFDRADWILSAYIRLLAMLHRARSRDGSVQLSAEGLGRAMGRRHADASRKRLRFMVKSELVYAAFYSDFVLILIPKYPVIQGLRPTKPRDEEKRRGREEKKKRAHTRSRSPAPDPDDPTEGIGAKDDREGKLAWLHTRLPQIVPAARAKLASQGCTSPSRRAMMAAVRERMMAYWTQHQKASAARGRASGRSPAQEREDRTKAAAAAVIADGG
jgi:hypothetical protein